MTKRRGILEDLGRALQGLACADFGEYLPLRTKDALLGVRATPLPRVSPPAPPPPAARVHRRIALAVQARLDRGALRYAHNACERLEADLDVLTALAGGSVQAAMESERRHLEERGHRLEVVRLGPDVLRGVAHYARTRSGVLFVVVGAEDPLAERVAAGHGGSHRVDVPWVVVAGADAA